MNAASFGREKNAASLQGKWRIVQVWDTKSARSIMLIELTYTLPLLLLGLFNADYDILLKNEV